MWNTWTIYELYINYMYYKWIYKADGFILYYAPSQLSNGKKLSRWGDVGMCFAHKINRGDEKKLLFLYII